MSEMVSTSDYVKDVSHDLMVLTRPSVRVPASPSASANVQWMRLRHLCRETEHPAATVDPSYSPETEFGMQVLGMITAIPGGVKGDVKYTGGMMAGLCIESEPLFIRYANILNPAFQQVGGAKPVVVHDGQSVVGLFKPTERPSILGLVDMPDFGLFAGAISELSDPDVQEGIVETARAFSEVGKVNIAELFSVGEGMRVVRATTFALDSVIRQGFSARNRANGTPYEGIDEILARINRKPLADIPELPLST